MNAKDRWKALFTRFDQIDFADDLYEELHTLYTEPHRAYHNLQHVSSCLAHLDCCQIPNSESNLLEFAIWYHDAIYSPFRKDNEEKSAQLAKKRLNKIGFDRQMTDSVERLILITRHNAEPANQNEAFMIDIDLSVLGSDREVYAAYESAIRREYKWVPTLLYKRKRKEVLHSFLRRNAIYSTTSFFERFEKQARVNLQWAIMELS